MVNPRQEKSRLGDLLVEMRLVDADVLSAALAEHRASGRRLARVLQDRRVLDEERLTKAVAAKLGLEAVTVSSLKIHERVLQLIPADIAQRHGVLPIAIKRTNQADLLYLVMVDPLDTEAIGEVQRVTGRQVRVLMATASDLDLAIQNHYRRVKTGGAASSLPPPKSPSGPAPVAQRPPPLRRSGAEVSARPTPKPAVVRGTPLPRTPSASERPRYPAMDQQTLIDSARPPELDALSLPPLMPRSEPSKLPPLEDDQLVVPQELDPPDSVSTRIDPGPFAKLERSDASLAPRSNMDRDWDLAVQAWGDMGDLDNNPLNSHAGSDERAPSKPDPVTTEASLGDLALFDDEDGSEEDLKTSQLELSEQGAAELRRHLSEEARPAPNARAARSDRRALMSTLEVPIEVADDHHPFDGPSVEEVPTGLERTGIIPAIDWDREEFVPPDPRRRSKSSPTLIGSTDIPTSTAEVEARFRELGEAPKAAPEEDVIEAIEEVSLDPLDSDEVIQFDEPEELPGPRAGGTARAPVDLSITEGLSSVATPSPAKREAISPSEDSDADRIPVIEPSSLMSLMDEGGDQAAADTGADVAPFGNWSESASPPATRLFDESNRQVVQPPEAAAKVGQEDEPTNPRIDTSSVQAALANDEAATVALVPEPLPEPSSDSDRAQTPKTRSAPDAALAAPPAAVDSASRSPTEAPPRADPSAARLPKPTVSESPETREPTMLDPIRDEVAEEDPTPSEDTVDRNSVLSALDGAFWEPASPAYQEADDGAASEPPSTSAGDTGRTPSVEAVQLVDALMAKDTLSSAQRAQLVLAIGRVLVERGVISRDALVDALDS